MVIFQTLVKTIHRGELSEEANFSKEF